MKNNMRSAVLAMVLCLSLVLVLSACGAGGASMEGKWVITAMTVGGEDYLSMFNELAASMGEESNIGDIMFCEFTKDGSFKMSMYEDEESGTYKLNGNKLTMTVDGEALEGTVNGNSFTITDNSDGEESLMTFTKK